MPPVHSKKPCSDCMFADGGKCEKHFSGGGETHTKRHESEIGQKGVHETGFNHRGATTKGKSFAGLRVRDANKYGDDMKSSKAVGYEDAKSIHQKTLGELRSTKGPTSGRSGFAKGGEVMRKDGKGEREVAGESGHSRGVHWQNRGVGSEAGTSHAGMHVKTNSRFPHEIRDEHKSVLRELKSMKGPQSGRSGFAEGGEVDADTLEDPTKPAGDDDMSDMIVDELMSAFEKKDKQGVKDAIEALVMERMNKGGM